MHSTAVTRIVVGYRSGPLSNSLGSFRAIRPKQRIELRVFSGVVIPYKSLLSIPCANLGSANLWGKKDIVSERLIVRCNGLVFSSKVVSEPEKGAWTVSKVML